MNNATIAGIVTTSPTLHRNKIGQYMIFDVMTRSAVCTIIANGDDSVLTEACSRVGCGSRIKLVGELAGPKGRNYLRIFLPDGLVSLKAKKQEEKTWRA